MMLMEWNGCSPFQWDWEHLFVLNGKSTENSKLQQTDWFGEVDRDINAGPFYLSWGDADSGSDHAHTLKSSKSASSISKSKTSKLTLQGIQEDSSGKEDVFKNELNESSPALEPSSSGEPLLSLKLGKRFYSEDLCPEKGFKSTSFSGIPISTSSTTKKCRSNIRSNQSPCCQVEGCNLDLSSAKYYHRKHRVCENHSKSPKVVVSGLERRFCQQCSRFHDLSQFDEKKRSCRKRLSNHNARRRKPHNESERFGSSLSSTSYAAGRRQQKNSLTFSGSNTSLGWQSTHSKHVQPKQFFMKSANRARTNEQSLFSSTESNIDTTFSDGLLRMLPSKGTTVRMATNQGSGESATATDFGEGEPFHRALSLLSTSSWDQCQTELVGLGHSRETVRSEITQHAIQMPLDGFPYLSSAHWLNEHLFTPASPP